ncbi:EsV-1-66 [Tribonema minus]|uniref:EsV-1-66 n=1 Tax=Tribonema minus TaxID=303371 RepID=A0A835ZFL4_9STRA|nr:EsV-1-66 [Tribonema minus]
MLTTCVRVPFTESAEQSRCVQELTVLQKALSPLSDPGTLIAYNIKDTLHGKVLEVPKFWGLDNLEKLGAVSVEDHQFEGVRLEDEDVVSAITQLRPHQVEATESIMKAFSKEYGGGGLLVLPCGYGKTVTALHVAAKMGVRGLIVCHTDVLVTQWAAAIVQYFPNARVGLIKQNTFNVDDKTHVIASLKSLAVRDYDMQTAGCELMIVDEAHHVCALQLSRAVANAGCKYRLGLSATPTRPDGLSDFLAWSIGEIVYEVTRPPADDLRVFAVMMGDGPVRTKLISRGGKDVSNIAGMINLLTDMTNARADMRQRVAAAWILLCASKRRKIIVLADRISLLRDLDRRVRDSVTTSFLFGAAKKAERAAAGDAQVVFASYGLAAEGLDLPLDTLILTTPRSGEGVITQTVGRIQRGRGRPPLVIDIVDAVPLFLSMFAKRLRVYKKLGAKMTKYDENRDVIA